MRKVFFLFMVFGLVGLMCGSASGFRADNIIKLKETGNCQKCDLWNANLEGADVRGADLTGADLSGANMKNIRNLDSAIKCKTIFSWGEDNSGCE